MRKILFQVMLAFILATIIMAIPLYFGKNKTLETRMETSEEYGAAKSPVPAAAIESAQTTTTILMDKNRVDYTNVYMMIFISLTISFIITIIFVRIRV
ncbi:MAG: hypothetical protein QXL89_01255 [Nitrososphaeria archaeon]